MPGRSYYTYSLLYFLRDRHIDICSALGIQYVLKIILIVHDKNTQYTRKKGQHPQPDKGHL